MLNRLKSIFNSNTDQQKRKDMLFDKIKPGDILIDCGANTGQETIPALKKGAIVYAFEPHPEAFAILQKKVGTTNKVHLYNQGVWDRKSKLKLYLHQNHDQNAVTWSTGASFVKEKENIDPSKFVEVDVIDLADFIEKLKRPVQFLKIDVEGVEFDILSGLIDRGIYKKVGVILVETHANKMKELKPKEEAIKKIIAKKKIMNISLDWV